MMGTDRQIIRRRLVAAAGAAAILGGMEFHPNSGQSVAAEMYFPRADWEVVAPGKESVDTAKLTAAVDYLRENSGPDGVHELVIIRNGQLIYEGDRTE